MCLIGDLRCIGRFFSGGEGGSGVFVMLLGLIVAFRNPGVAVYPREVKRSTIGWWVVMVARCAAPVSARRNVFGFPPGESTKMPAVRGALLVVVR